MEKNKIYKDFIIVIWLRKMVLQTMGQDTTQSFKKKLGIFLEDPHCARILDMH